jgi:aminopeptidase N
VNYDLRNWKLISAFLNSNKYADISVLNRALLLDDALDLARVGLLPYEVALNVSSYLRQETHYLPWKAAFRNLDYIARMLRLTDGLAGYKVSGSTLLGFRPSVVNQIHGSKSMITSEFKNNITQV